ncbi:MAG: ricin-type beta-trefoil lectin domain protein [Polyangiaceae bacterium]
MPNTRIRGLGGLCVVVTSKVVGAPLATALCGTDPQLEHWEVRPSEIRLAGTSLCATSADAVPDVDTSVVLKECGSEPTLQQVRMGDGRIRLDGLCFDVRGAFPIPGSTIVLWNSCPWELDNDEFYFSGAVTTKNRDYCLTVDPSVGGITAVACNDSTYQEWDFHF